MCPNVTISGDFDVDDRRFFPGMENNQILREELGSVNITSTPKKAAWPFFTLRRSSGLKELDEPVCKAVMFDVASVGGTVGGVELSRGIFPNPIEGVPESFVTSSGFSTLEAIAQRQVDRSFVDARLKEKVWCAFHQWRTCWSSLSSPKCSQLVLRIRWKTSVARTVCHVDGTSL